MLGAVNSINFKGNSLKVNNQTAFKGSYDGYTNFTELDNIVTKLKTTEEEFAPDKKSKLGVLASLALGTAALFALGKRGYTQIGSIVNGIAGSKVGKQAQDVVGGLVNKGLTKAAEKNDRVAETIQNLSDKLPKAQAQVSNVINKAGGAQNIAGAVTAIGGTAYVTSVDGNGDGISDIAQKGVNAYKNAIHQAGVVGELIEALT